MGCCATKDERVQGANFELTEPVLDFDSQVFEHGGVQAVQCSVQGWRKTMEDVALVQCGVSPREDVLALGVFDGHSGSEAAQFAKEKLLGHIKSTDEWRRADVSAACINGFLSADEAMRKSGVKSGTTAVLALVSEEEIVVANCGDSRSVLSRGGRQLPMSIDHKPGRKTEKRRILRGGGYLDEGDPDHPRVVCDKLNMSIATSRALGDFDFKTDPSRQPEEQMISPVPEFYTRERVPEDEFLILATDGVWDVMDNPGIVQFLKEQAYPPGADNNGQPDGSPDLPAIDKLARQVLHLCLRLGSRDNMTIVLADLRPKPKAKPKPPEKLRRVEVPSTLARADEQSVSGMGRGGSGQADSGMGVNRSESPDAAAGGGYTVSGLAGGGTTSHSEAGSGGVGVERGGDKGGAGKVPRDAGVARCSVCSAGGSCGGKGCDADAGARPLAGSAEGQGDEIETSAGAEQVPVPSFAGSDDAAETTNAPDSGGNETDRKA